jgi:hypothetical protein
VVLPILSKAPSVYAITSLDQPKASAFCSAACSDSFSIFAASPFITCAIRSVFVDKYS